MRMKKISFPSRQHQKPKRNCKNKRRAAINRALRLMLVFGAVPLVCFCVLLFMPLATYADGGAPNRAYVAGTGKGISIIGVAQQKIIGSLATQGEPHEVLLSLDGRFLYVTQPQQENLTILSAATGDTICKANVPGQPTLLALDTNSNTLYVAGNGAASVSAIDVKNCNVKRTIQTAGPVYGLAIAAIGTTDTGSNGDQVWVSTKNQLDIFNDNDGSKISSVNVPGGPRYISIPPGSAAYVTTQQGGVVAIGLARHDVTPLISGGQYGPMDFDEATGEIFVPNRLHNLLDVLAPINPGFPVPKEPERTIALASAPNSIAITSDGQLGFVALQGGYVDMLDVPGRQLITTFNVGGDPQFIITGLNPPAIATTPQQASILGTLINIAAYALVAALIIVPIIFFLRYARSRKNSFKEKMEKD
jgi:DNA-binding beta-propeller fold protein YncE